MALPPTRNQKVSLEKYLQSRHEDSQKFEARLKLIKSNDPDAAPLRIKICEYLTDLILTDPSFACELDIVDRLWRLCFYERIRVLRATRDKVKRRGEDFGKQQDALLKHVSEAISLYNYLTETLEDKLMKAYPALSGTQASQEDSDDDDTSRPSASKSPGGIMKCLIPMIVQLGDLHRYGDSTSHAQVAYKRAIQLGPGIGHAMNQLAVILSQADPAGQRLVTLYWYARSISVTAEPFTTSTKNLARLFESNQEWLSEQENQQQSTLPNAKPVQSKLFLAKFCQLHAKFFNGFLLEEMADVGIYQQMKDCRDLFSNILQNSALGDSLLCKLVTVHAFSETVADRARAASVANRDQLTQATAWAARVSTLWLGTALAERVLRTPSSKVQQLKKTQSSYRCLVPMMLVAEYVASRPIPAWKSFPNDFGKPDLVALHTDAENEFWKTIVDVLNHILPQSHDSGTESMTETAHALKEYLELRGFLPFATFVAGISPSGRLSDEDAVRELSMRRKGKGRTQESASTLTSGASVQSTADNADQNRIKVFRLHALGEKWAGDQDSVFARLIQFDERNNTYLFVGPDDDDNGGDVNMVLCNEDEVESCTNDLKNVSPPDPMESSSAPVVYHKSSDGGPALLLPSYLVEPNSPGSTSHTPMDTSDINPEKSNSFPSLPVRQVENVNLLAASSSLQVASINPPPGFGSSTTPRNVSTLGQNNEYGSSHRLFDSLPSSVQQAQQTPLFRLFGDEYLQTTNPFADTQYQSAHVSLGTDHAATRHSIQNDNLFGHQDDFGVHEASLLDSGLWKSIFKDDPPPPTTNPFAT